MDTALEELQDGNSDQHEVTSPPLDKLRKMIRQAYDTPSMAREKAEATVDYFHGDQLSPAVLAKMAHWHQAPSWDNKIRPAETPGIATVSR